MSDKRKPIRWNINKQAQVKLEAEAAPFNCVVKNISFRGVQIASSFKLPRDVLLRLGIILEGSFNLDVEVWVAWHRYIDTANVYGLYFTKISDSDKERLYRYILKNFPEQISRQWWQGVSREKGDKDMDDRRIFARFSVKLSVRYLKANQDIASQANASNISAKGIGLVTAEGLQPQTSLEIWIELPDRGGPFYTRGEVVWSKKLDSARYAAGLNLEKAELLDLASFSKSP